VPRRAIAGSYPTQQGEASCRLRNGDSQIVRVEQVHVNEGGQAVIVKRETCAQFRKAMSS